VRIDAKSLWKGEHLPFAPGNFTTVVDGDIIERVVEADDEEGWVVAFIDGEFKKVFGSVEFIPMWE